MNTNTEVYDVIVIGSGPAGQNAAITAAEQGARVLVIEREIKMGGACVQYGTIPSKTLRETAVTLSALRRRSGGVYDVSQRQDLQVHSLMTRLHQVVDAHQETTQRYLEGSGVVHRHGQAEFLSPHTVRIENNLGEERVVHGDFVIIATGSRPRNPPTIPVDHENILDSDSILSMTYLPQSLTVFGGGVIASEYAATFASLGVKVFMVDRYPSPMGFLDEDLVSGFVRHFERNGGEFRGSMNVKSVEWDGISQVVTTLDDETVITSDKALVAQGRVANTDALNLEAAGLDITDRGLVSVNDHFQTVVPWIYAVGDMIGPPALASSSMEQGRRAANHAFGIPEPVQHSLAPMGIYTIPEIASVGLNETQARIDHDDVLVARVKLTDLARGQIMAATEGMLKLIADRRGRQVLGVQIIGDGATELVHIGQMAMLSSTTIDALAGTIFNFPTLAEAYRIAALAIIHQRDKCPAASTDAGSNQLISTT